MDFRGDRHIAQAPLVITPEVLSSEQKKLAEEYIALTELSGVFVGAIVGASDWDIRPLILDAGELKVIRFSNPERSFDNTFFSEIDDLLKRLPNLHSVSITAAGVIGHRIWQARPFYQKTLAEFGAFYKAAIGISTQDLISQLLKAVNFWHNSGIVHGHLSLSNIAIDSETVNVVDFAFAAVHATRSSVEDFAPELLQNTSISKATDIFGLGLIFQEVLGRMLTPEQYEILQAMLDPVPARRPNIRMVRKVFSSEPKMSHKQSAFQKAAPDDELRLGRVLGENLSVQQDSLKSEGGTSDSSAGEVLKPSQGSSIATPEKKDDVESSPKKKEGSFLWLLIVTVLAAGFILFRNGYLSLDPKTLSGASYGELWQTGIPSVMAKVAEAAVNGDINAQLIIQKDVMSGGRKAGVQVDLLQIAFDSRWESKLNERDRSIAFHLGLSNIMQDSSVVPSLEGLHPGVLFAIVATRDGKNNLEDLNKISVQVLFTLVAPIGTIFEDMDKGTSLGDDVTIAAAKILTGMASPEELTTFFSAIKDQNVLVKQILLISSFPHQKFSGEQIFEAISRGNGVGRKLTDWINAPSPVNWKIKPTPIKMKLFMSDLPMDESLKVEDYADLLTCPDAEIKASAAALLLKRFLPKNSQDTIAVLVDPNLPLTRKQLVSFVSTIAMKKNLQYRLFEEWFELEPDLNTSLKLLLARKMFIDDPFNVAVTRYLKDKEWNSSNETLKELVQHKEPLARAMAYARLNPTDSIQLKILLDALKVEPTARLRKQIREKIRDVGIKLQ
ncbi:MAG: protein kinase domain-containing protein [Bdellovibrionota bacterium]|jgi:serine/threonine protein kinase